MGVIANIQISTRGGSAFGGKNKYTNSYIDKNSHIRECYYD